LRRRRREGERLDVRAVLADTLRVYRRHWLFLIGAAIVILLPQAVVDGLLAEHQVDGVRSAADVALLLAIPLTVVVSLLGQAIYAGFAAAAVVEWRLGLTPASLGQLIRALPIGRLIVLDLILSIGAAVGLLLLVVPGVVFLTYFSIAPAVVKIEHLGVWPTFKRSFELVSGQFWRVSLLVVGAIVLVETLVQALTSPFHDLGPAVLSDVAAEGLFQPFEGLVIVLTAIALLELRGEIEIPERSGPPARAAR
jgi:hypothetical protein